MKSNYDLHPAIPVKNDDGSHPPCWTGWQNILQHIDSASTSTNEQKVITIECYNGVSEEEIIQSVSQYLPQATVIRCSDAYFPEEKIGEIVAPYNGGDDPVFGFLTKLCINDYFDPDKLATLQNSVSSTHGTVVVIGTGATLVHPRRRYSFTPTSPAGKARCVCAGTRSQTSAPPTTR